MAHRKWDRARVISEIRALHRAGESLSTRNMARLGYSGMVTSCYNSELFGSWLLALEAAGVDPKQACGRRRKWTRDSIVAEIRRLHGRGVDLSHSAVKRTHQYLVVAAKREAHFGAWRAAMEAAGIDYGAVSKHQSWTRQKVVARIRRLHRRGEPLNHQDAKTSHPSLVAAASSRRLFGSWALAVEAAGIDYASIRKTTRWTKAKIVRTIRTLGETGRPLNNSSMRRMGYRGLMEAARRPACFGSWEAAIRAAGLEYDQIRRS